MNQMSKNVLSADNPQEMLKQKYYFSGFLAGEMSCSIIKATNKHPKGFYYAVDLTVTNADKALLTKVNKVVMKNRGVITPVKGAYNLSARGKERVNIALNFLEKYPVIIGDLAINRLLILKDALEYLNTHKTSKFQKEKMKKMDILRKKLRDVKEKCKVDKKFTLQNHNKDILGHFFSGIIDAEGSFGIKSSGLSRQLFFAIAMKDKKIIEALQKFVGYGNVRSRKDGVCHLEITKHIILKKVCALFLDRYPLQNIRQRKRLNNIQQLLNDYTPNADKTYRMMI